MEVWQGLQQHVEEVIRELETHKREHSPEHYLQVRAELPESLPARAGRFIYLNRTCYNGLYRENRAGQFNVPMGRYRNPKILNEAGLRAVSQSLQGVSLRTLSFQRVIRRARRGDLVYFDPPYQPISPTASFTAYSRHPFGETEQEELAAICARLQERGVHVMISNSWTPYTRELYPTLQRQAVQARRSLSREGNSRTPVSELLATSW